MKILIVGDIHWSTYSSILRSRGNNFSTRLEGLIHSLNWVEQVAKEYDCEEEIFLGDTFDKPDLSAEEISALSEVCWNTNSRCRHFIVGNHESGIASLVYNSTQVLHKVGVIEDVPYLYPLDDKIEILFLPYIVEDNRKSLSEYLKNRSTNKKLIICSHNDIKDFQMGMFLSKTGFSVDDIEANCDLYLNGHLHNAGQVTNKIINVGVLSGQNFSEDAFKYEHHIAILDTNTMRLQFIENPYAFNFYKIDVDSERDLVKFSKLKENSIVSIKCEESLKDVVEHELNNSKIICSKVCYYTKTLDDNVSSSIEELQTVDHLEKFQQFVIDKLGRTDIVLSELMEVCK